ncbi:ubiquitin carboxyl-terminal hydrolase 2-like isoform X2 [Chrysoperla carnea]|uniref:ubiquitin carboxyl-terminal hydrolase 2-like isoform X2 n=1 Tax=Chrysoperla carnea TaxID=189513 RepID=UPI001D095EDA|nr:ubiquitin carboxyl-terminal hydrolase 2-like isoform X2 [Chrysoperla carnea]
MSVEVCLSNSGYNNTKNLITMPVVSQRRSSTSSTTTTSPLTGSYRSTSSSDRSYYGGTSTATSTFSRNSSYLRNLDSKRVYSRHTSISEDSGIGSRTSSYTRSDRETSIRRGDSQPHDISGLTLTGRRISSISIANSVDDIRQKYSPSNYVPNIRKPESNKLEITRSKSITNDIGKPPTVVERKISPSIERKTSPTSVERRVNKDLSTSPRLNRSTIASTNGSSTISALNRSSPLERHREEKTTNSYNSKSDKNIGLNGLKNIGNTCFMNSVIQCLSNTRLLLEYLRDNTYLNDINTTNSSMKGALVKAFANVIQELWGDDSDKIVNPSSLKYQIQHFAPRFMGYAQQDAQEFLRYLLEGLHEDVNRVKAKPPPILTEIDDKLSDSQKSMEAWNRYLRIDDSNIVDIFVGQLKSTLKCSVCGYCSVTFDPFWDLSLPIGSGSITQCLENFTREEVMDGHEKPTCSKCQTRRKCTKSFSIQKFPKILVLHLKRFSPNERFRGKLTTLIDFPLQNLDLSAFAANRGTSSVYNLYAVSNHSGTTYSGHYTAYCKHPYSGEWHEYNDSRVSTISSRHVVSSEAYVLFYELSGHSSHL